MILETHTIHKLRKAVGYTSCKYLYLYVMKEVIIPFVRLSIVTSANEYPGPQPLLAASDATSSEPDL